MRCSWRRYIISHCATSPIPPDGRRGIVGNDILQYRRQLHAGMGMGMRVIGAALRALRPASAAWRIPVPGLRDLELRSTLVSAGPTCMRFRRSTPPCRSANFRRSLLPAPPPPPPPTASTASNRCPRSAPSRCAAPPPRRRGRRSTASRTRRPSARPTGRAVHASLGHVLDVAYPASVGTTHGRATATPSHAPGSADGEKTGPAPTRGRCGEEGLLTPVPQQAGGPRANPLPAQPVGGARESNRVRPEGGRQG